MWSFLRKWTGLWFLGGSLAFADYGPRYVERELPDFYRAVLQNIAYEPTQAFFKEWTPAEVDEFRSLQSRFVEKHIPRYGSVPAPIELFERAGEKIFSALGELYGASMLRARARGSRSLLFASEDSYRALNVASYRNPDGLLYRIEGNDVYLLSILESKLGKNVRLTDRQVEGLVDQWRTRGIRLPDANGRIQFFSNLNIYIGERDSRMPVSFINADGIRSVMTLVSHRPRSDFPGGVLRPPFSPIEGRNIVFEYLEKLVEKRRWLGQAYESVPYEVTAEELVPVVKDWIIERNSWPKESGKRVEKLLARKIRLFGGQSAVFMELDAEHQEILYQAGMVPALGSLDNALAKLKQRTPGALRAIRYFAISYFPNEPIEVLLERYRATNPLYRFIRPSDIPSTCQLKLQAHAPE